MLYNSLDNFRNKKKSEENITMATLNTTSFIQQSQK